MSESSLLDFITIEISADKMSAECTILAWQKSSNHSSESPTEETSNNIISSTYVAQSVSISASEMVEAIENEMARLGIAYGIDRVALTEKSKNWYDSGNTQKFRLANGLGPTDGNEGSFLQVCFQQKNPILYDKIEYRESGFVWNVDKDVLLATVKQSMIGVSGFNVFGENLKPREVNIVDPEITKMVRKELIDGVANYYANESGILEEISQDRISLVDSISIKQDVDYKTGNIQAYGSVKIVGNIRPHFSVKSRGNIEIEGTVEGAYVESAGDMQVQGGVIGKPGETEIKCGGNLSAKFIENTLVVCDGDVSIENSTLNSQIYCAGKLSTTKQSGTIRTCRIVAGTTVEANVYGSESEGKNLIAAGNNPIIWQRMSRLQRELRFTRRLLNKGGAAYGKTGVKGIRRLMRYRSAKQKRLVSIMERVLARKQRAIVAEVASSNEPPYIGVMQKLHPGTRVMIGPVSKTVEETLNKGKFFLNLSSHRLEWKG